MRWANEARSALAAAEPPLASLAGTVWNAVTVEHVCTTHDAEGAADVDPDFKEHHSINGLPSIRLLRRTLASRSSANHPA